MKEKKKVNPLIRILAIIAWIIFAVFVFQSCTGDENETDPTYTIESESFKDPGRYYADIKMDAASEEEIQSVAEDVMNEKRFEQRDTVTSAFIRVYQNDALVAIAKIAYNNVGRAQTGLDKEQEWNIEMQ